ncbi:hypothetical protein ABW20_dc0103615 [Dactylellina cionopaga]|nr:hypothetical protein ABW20_dc0103615 [Dactylellina cionopaga]
MSGLEIPAFIVGLSNLIAVFEKTFLIWRTIRAAYGFGEDIADTLAMLEMEFFRFQTWWTALQHLTLAHKPKTQVSKTPSDLQEELQRDICQPIIAAADAVLKSLEEVESLLRKNGVLGVMVQRPDQDPQAPLSVSHVRHRQIDFATEVSKKTPWHKRLLHNTDIWKDSDKKSLQTKLENIRHWNDSLYSILPQNLRNSILEIGIAGYILPIPGDAQRIAKPSHLTQMAILKENRRAILNRQPDPDLQRQLNRMKKDLSQFGILPYSTVSYSERYTITEYMPSTNDPKDQECRVVIEWYPYPKEKSIDTARQRIAQIAYLLQSGQGAVNLSTLDALGYVEKAKNFGLVLRLPTNTLAPVEPVILHSLLARKLSSQYNTLPTLNSRYALAITIASSFYSFMFTRWHHERFSSLKVFFLLPQQKISAGISHAQPDISSPIIGGFDISRPDSTTEVSIQGSSIPEDAELLYLHPVLRKAFKNNDDMNTNPSHAIPPPRYQRVYDVYSFGIFLVEVGFWNIISNIVKRSQSTGSKASLSPDEFKDAIIQKCENDLACWMGEAYRDITLACLRAEDTGTGASDQQDAQELNDFYWNVVVNLLQIPSNT